MVFAESINIELIFYIQLPATTQRYLLIKRALKSLVVLPGKSIRNVFACSQKS